MAIQLSTVVNSNWQEYDQLIDRRTKFGNPYPMRNKSDEERKRVIEEYRQWFHQPEQTDLRISAISQLTGKRLGCHCSPKACHGDVIVEYVNSWKKEDGF